MASNFNASRTLGILDIVGSLAHLAITSDSTGSSLESLPIVVCSPRLLAAVAHRPDQLRMVNALCAFVDEAT